VKKLGKLDHIAEIESLNEAVTKHRVVEISVNTLFAFEKDGLVVITDERKHQEVLKKHQCESFTAPNL
jgi:hypothetical protein